MHLPAFITRPRVAIPTLVAICLLSNALTWFLAGPPTAFVHDEFSFLLLGETLASGRLTNAPHAAWEFFETFHVINQPSYTSKYLPLQGAFLALGFLAGHPILGVWLGQILTVLVIYGIVYRWMSRGWAFLGGLLSILFLGLHSHWSTNFSGGFPPALGGLLGVWGMLLWTDKREKMAGTLLGCGAVLLCLSRPYEGAVHLLALGGMALLLVLGRNRQVWQGLWRRVLPLAGSFVLGGLVLLGVYNHATTGSPTQLAYQAYAEQYAGYIGVLGSEGQLDDAPGYRHKVFERAAVLDQGRRPDWDSLAGRMQYRKGKLLKAFSLWGDHALGPISLLWLPIAPFLIRHQRDRVMVWSIISSVVAVTLASAWTPWSMYSHYLSPAIGGGLLLHVWCLMRLTQVAWPRRHMGMVLVGLWLGINFVLQGLAWKTYMERERWNFRLFRHRADLVDQWKAQPGRDLVFMSYGPNQRIHDEWVYNGANIDAQPVVWARDMGDEKNAELIEYFARVWREDGLRVWKVHIDGWKSESDVEVQEITPVSAVSSEDA